MGARQLFKNINMAANKLRNEKNGLTAFFSRHREALKRYVGKKMFHSADVEDVVQETFIRLLKRERVQPEALQSMASPEAYMYRTASNLVIDRLRQRKARVDEGDREELDDAMASTPLGPLRVIESRQRLQQLKRAIDDLPPKCRQVFVLHKYQQMPYRDVAEHLNISVSMVEKHMMKALIRLDSILGGKD